MPDVGNSLKGLEQKQELLVLLGLFKTVLPICTPKKMVNHSQHRMYHASNLLGLDSAEVACSICHLNRQSLWQLPLVLAKLLANKPLGY